MPRQLLRKHLMIGSGCCVIFAAIGWWNNPLVVADSRTHPVGVRKLGKLRLPSPHLLRQGPILQAPADRWTWFDLPETKCGYGTSTGLALNPSSKPSSRTLVIMMQGGGACWKERGTFGRCFSLGRSAFSLQGIKRKSFHKSWRLNRIKRSFLMQRKHKDNPIHQAHYAILPYCTGDLHLGNAVAMFRSGRKMYFWGYRNMHAYLKRLVPTFPKVKRVILVGISAGAVGASLHWQRVQRAFGPKVRVDLLNDAGAPVNPLQTRWKRWTQAWNMQFPEGCHTCDKGIEPIFKYYSKTMFPKGNRFAFVGHTRDRVVRSFLGLPFFGKLYPRRLYRSLTRFDQHPQAQYFVLESGHHSMLVRRGAAKLKAESGVTLGDWLRQYLREPDKWQSTHPAHKQIASQDKARHEKRCVSPEPKNQTQYERP